jgi:excisionase family DNA binding protein
MTRPTPPRLALRVDEVAEALGVSRDFVDTHVAAELRWIRRGRLKLCAIAEIQRWLEQNAAFTLDDERGRR